LLTEILTTKNSKNTKLLFGMGTGYFLETRLFHSHISPKVSYGRQKDGFPSPIIPLPMGEGKCSEGMQGEGSKTVGLEIL